MTINEEEIAIKLYPTITKIVVSTRSNISILYVLIIILLLSFTIWYIGYSWKRRELYRKAAKIPYVNGWKLPFIGIAHYMLGNTENFMNTLIHFCANGSPAIAWLCWYPITFVHKPEDIEIVLNSHETLDKYHLYRFSKNITGIGLFTAPARIWKTNRKIIMPTFNQKVLNQFFDVFSDQSEILSEVLMNDVGKTIDINDKLSNWSLDIVCKTAMGVNLSSQTKNSELLESLHRAFEVIFTRIVKVIYHNDFIYSLTKMAKVEKVAVKAIDKFVDKILRQKYVELEEKCKEIYSKPEAEITDEKKMVAFLDLFLDRRYTSQQLTDKELTDEIKTILVTGSDTSATALGFVLLMIAMFPSVQRRIYDEIVDICGLNRSVLLEDLPNFKYMERVIKETMRLFPLGPFIFRNVNDDLKITNYTLPKGSGVGIATIVLHRSDEYWPNPLKFEPDRFLPEEIGKRHPYAYIPFSGGPRNCIGMKYAMMSLKTLIANLVRKYHLATHYKCVEEIRCRQDMLIKPVEGFPIKLTLRSD